MHEPEIKIKTAVQDKLEFIYTPTTNRTSYFISDLGSGSIHIKDKIPAGETNIVVDIAHLSSGMYLLCIVDGERRFEKKFQKL